VVSGAGPGGGRVPEADLFEVEGVLDDPGGGDPHPEDVLLRGQVVALCYSVDGRQVAGRVGKVSNGGGNISMIRIRAVASGTGSESVA
jgi:hypothetical protein